MALRQGPDKRIFQAELQQLSQSQNLTTIFPSQTETHSFGESEESFSFQGLEQSENSLAPESLIEVESSGFTIEPHFDFKLSPG